MTDIYYKHRSEAVKKYLQGDNKTLKNNYIFYPIGRTDLVPKPVNLSYFNYGGIYYPLTYLLPKEIWHIIFEMKYIIEKMEYVTFYFSPEYESPQLLHVSRKENGVALKYFKPNTVIGRLYNDFADVVNASTAGGTRIERSFNMISSFKEFVTKWYLFIKEMVHQLEIDRMLRETGRPEDELFFKGDDTKGKKFIKLFYTVRGKVEQFEEDIAYMVVSPTERNKLMLVKILIHDIEQYMSEFLRDEMDGWIGMNVWGHGARDITDKRDWKLDEPLAYNWEIDFFQYYSDFPSWVKTCGIESQEDLFSFMEECSDNQDNYYYNPKWFEKIEDSDDFPLWVMIQEFC